MSLYRVIKKHFWLYLLELIIAIAIYNFSLKAFLIYFFLSVIIKIDLTQDYLRKIIRVFQVANEYKLIAIIRKLNIKKEDMQKIVDEMDSKLTDKQKESLTEDLNDVLNL